MIKNIHVSFDTATTIARGDRGANKDMGYKSSDSSKDN